MSRQRRVRVRDPVRDPFRDLRDDRVAQSFKTVHSSGYPMSHSTQVGFNAPLSSAGVTIERSFSRDQDPPHLHMARPPVFVTAVGVGQSPWP